MSDTIADYATPGDAEGYGLLDTRYAVYLVPPLGSALKRLADAWVGRDPDIREPIPHPLSDDLAPERIQAITAAPRQYGFHGTLKAPFGLAEGAEAGDLRDAADAFANTRGPFAVRLRVASVDDGFIALVPAGPSPELDALAADCVREFDRFRAPLSAEDRERRHPERLTARQREHLEAWGYPYVLDEFRFHMTLTDRLEEPEQGRVKDLLERFLAPALAEPVPVGDIALFAQTHRVAPFNVVARFPFGRGS